METGDSHRARMQATAPAQAPKDKKRGVESRREDAEDPEYENITLTFRHRDQKKGGHSAAKNQNPSPFKSSSNSTTLPSWLHQAILSLYVILALTFLFCIILSSLILVNNSNTYRELQGLRRDLSNVSSWVRECQSQQAQGWNNTKIQVQEARNSINNVRNDMETVKNLLNQLLSDTSRIKSDLDVIKQNVEKINTPKPA